MNFHCSHVYPYRSSGNNGIFKLLTVPIILNIVTALPLDLGRTHFFFNFIF